MRCPDDAEMKCVELRSKIIHEVLQAKQYCEALRMTESFIQPNQIQYPVTIRDKLYLVTDTSNAIAKKGKCVVDQHGQSAVPIDELLFFFNLMLVSQVRCLLSSLMKTMLAEVSQKVS